MKSLVEHVLDKCRSTDDLRKCHVSAVAELHRCDEINDGEQQLMSSSQQAVRAKVARFASELEKRGEYVKGWTEVELAVHTRAHEHEDMANMLYSTLLREPNVIEGLSEP